jgi:HK97 family phage portal protein
VPIISGAVTKSTAPDRWALDGGLSSANGFGYSGDGTHPLGRFLVDACAYDLIYERHLWPQIAINTLVELNIQLPAKVYERADKGRLDARTSPFGRLLAEPTPAMDPVAFWTWFIYQRHIHGRSFALKVRDAGGRPAQLELIHPTRMRFGCEGNTASGPMGWWYRPSLSSTTELPIARSQFLHWHHFHPKHPELALSPLEGLRDTLEMEAAVRVSGRAMFARGGKHSLLLKTPKNFGGNGQSPVLQRLADQYDRRHGGAENHGRPLILEDGMDAVPLDMNNVDLQYIEQRKLDREEVAAAFRIPAPAMGINDHATFSNVTEQNRMLYRLAMPPILQSFEAMVNFDLRDGRHGDRTRAPDFSDLFYFEWLVDGVLRGSTEERITAHAQGIQTGQLTPAEAREMENRPFIEGSDQLFVNSAMVTMTEVVENGQDDPKAMAELVQKLYLGTPEKIVLSVDEARSILNRAGAGFTGPAPQLGRGTISAASVLTDEVVSKVMGRLSRPVSLDVIDLPALVAGLDDGPAVVVGQALDHVKGLGGDVAGLRKLIKELGSR